MRELGTNAYRYVNGGSDGSISGVLMRVTLLLVQTTSNTLNLGVQVTEGNPDPKYHMVWAISLVSLLRHLVISYLPT